MKAEIEANTLIDVDQKEEIAADILQQVKALKEVKEETENLPVGKQASGDVSSVVETTLDRADTLINKLQSTAKKTVEVAETIGKFVVSYGPLIASARHLFGIP
jgi:hypothetical protein